MGPQIGRRHVLLQVADEERPRRLRVVLVQVGFQGPELVIVQIQAGIPGRHFNFAPEKELVPRHFQRLVHILGLLETHYGHSVRALAGHFDRHHFAVLLVLVEEAVLEARVRRAEGKVAHANGQRSPVIRTAAATGAATADVGRVTRERAGRRRRARRRRGDV